MKPVIQEETTGCGIASVANIIGKSYSELKEVANSMGIYASDESLWSDTQYVRRILTSFNIETSRNEIPFKSWNKLPGVALLSTKYRQDGGRSLWHWVVFKRVKNESFVLDSASYLSSNIRTDFNNMHPKWYIEVKNV